MLTPAATRLYSASMNSEAGSHYFEKELARLEKRLDELLVICRQLQDENVSLRQRQDALMNERAKLVQVNDQVRSRVEAMITRLKAMENTP